MTTPRLISLTWMLAIAGMAGLAAQNLSGRITCDGHGVADVAVSDGNIVVLTDANGYYTMTSDKANGYVFYTLPGGYEPVLADGFNPQFWAPLTSTDVTVQETHDFTLQRVDNDRHIVIFGADTHLARRNSDRAFFKKGFLASLNDEVARADGTPIYSVLLGDLTWDVFWYQNEYDLTDFMDDMQHFNYPMALWAVIGNHDHDPSIPAGNDTDERSSQRWREIVCPTYYSFNLGKVHYVVLDDIVYLNDANPGDSNPEGVAGSRNYQGRITAEQMTWLAKDLALVSPHTPVVVCLHIPAWGISSSFGFYSRLDNTSALASMLNKFDNVHIMSGHTHGNYVARPSYYSHITEHNIATVSGNLWNSGAASGHHINQDGSPAGYLRWTVDGTAPQWTYQSIHAGDSQMRLYDMNTVRNYYQTNSTIRAILKDYPSRVNYAQLDSNVVMFNVFCYDPKWRVSVCEGNTMLACQRTYTEDPFHTLAYDIARYSAVGYYTSYYATTANTHMFKAQATTSREPITVRVIDTFGNIYLKSIKRPHTYNLSMDKREKDLMAGDVNSDSEINIADINLIIDIMLGNGSMPCPPVLADCNGDDEISIGDINTIIKLIYNR